MSSLCSQPVSPQLNESFVSLKNNDLSFDRDYSLLISKWYLTLSIVRLSGTFCGPVGSMQKLMAVKCEGGIPYFFRVHSGIRHLSMSLALYFATLAWTGN